jgi:hypothetical protein
VRRRESNPRHADRNPFGIACVCDRYCGRFTGRFKASSRGIVVEATSLDALEIPAEVLSQANLQLEIGVTHYKPPGAAWAQLVIIVVYITPEGVAI